MRTPAARVFFVDVTYDIGPHSEDQTVKGYKEILEAEFGIALEPVNIGQGADIPSFMVEIPHTVVWVTGGVLALVYAGKPIKDGIDAWIQLAQRVRSYFPRPLYPDSTAAFSLAIERTKDLHGIADGITILEYYCIERRLQNKIQPEDDETLDYIDRNAGEFTHCFHIECQGRVYKITIDGRSIFMNILRK